MHPDNVYEYQLYFGNLLDKPYFHTYCKEEKEEKMEENHKFYLSVVFDNESEFMILRTHIEPCFKHSTCQWVYEPDKIYPDGDTEEFVDCINLLVKQIWLFLTTKKVFLDEDGDPVVDYSKISELAYRIAVDFFQDMDEPVMWDITDIENPEKQDDVCEYCEYCDDCDEEEDEKDEKDEKDINAALDGLETKIEWIKQDYEAIREKIETINKRTAQTNMDLASLTVQTKERLEKIEKVLFPEDSQSLSSHISYLTSKLDRHECEINSVFRQMTEMQKQINTALDVVMLHLNN